MAEAVKALRPNPERLRVTQLTLAHGGVNIGGKQLTYLTESPPASVHSAPSVTMELDRMLGGVVIRFESPKGKPRRKLIPMAHCQDIELAEE